MTSVGVIRADRVCRLSLAVTWLLLTACSQNTQAAASPSTTSVARVSPSATPSTSSLPATPSSSPPGGAAGYATPQDAGIAGVEAKTGLTYSGGSCSANQSCLGAPQLLVSPDPSQGYNATGIQVSVSGSVKVTCFAYVYYDSAGWHYTSPVVCPQRSGYNPVPMGEDHVRVPGSCANMRQGPGLSFSIVTCVKDGILVNIYGTSFPRWVDGHIWWEVGGQGSANPPHGWMALDFLITPDPA